MCIRDRHHAEPTPAAAAAEIGAGAVDVARLPRRGALRAVACRTGRGCRNTDPRRGTLVPQRGAAVAAGGSAAVATAATARTAVGDDAPVDLHARCVEYDHSAGAAATRALLLAGASRRHATARARREHAAIEIDGDPGACNQVDRAAAFTADTTT